MRRFLLILLLLILAGGAYWYFMVRPHQQPNAAAGNSGFRSFFSLGNQPIHGTIDAPAGPADNSTSTQTTSQSSSPFAILSVGPVAGYTAYTTTQTITVPATAPKAKPTKQVITSHIIRYVSRATGYVYEIKDGGIPTQITNIFIPNIYEAQFADANKTAIVRFLRDDNQTISTYSIPIPDPNPDGTRTQKEGTYLPDGIASLAVSPDQKTVARIVSDPSAASVVISTSTGSNAKTVLQSPFREWLLSWANQLYAQTKASATADGYLYRVDQTSKRLLRVVGSVPGLTASVSPKGTYVLYSQSGSGTFSTKLLTVKTGTVKDLGVSILPEKCVWLANEDAICAGSDAVPTATYPDDWYKGLLSFSDKLYRIYAGGGIIDTLNSGNPTSYDITNPEYDQSQNTLYFMDKKTGLLWQYSL